MSPLTLELDPTAIRVSLQRSRERGLSFEQAWADATRGHPTSRDEGHVVTFMRKHFRAAYLNTAETEGRCMVPGRDVSSAVQSRREDACRSGGSGCASTVAPPDGHASGFCRSGDGCDRLATHGRHGVMWCKYHADELERIAAKFARERNHRDPRAHGNSLIFGSKGKRAA